MKGVLKLGNVSGIRLEVHWTFIFLLLWIVFIEVKRGSSVNTLLTSILFIIILFACVVLHELGHALTARNFNIKTEKIMLLPIGGVANLEKMPENPMEEFKVAIAGPLVNLAIALVLVILFPVTSYFDLTAEELIEFMNAGNFDSFVFNLFLANLVLIVFNLIPAFPMDGGRVLRALLSTQMERSKATSIAAGLGQLLAFFFFILGILFNPFLVFIALFIFLGAFGENRMEQQLHLVKNYTVQDAMLTDCTRVYEHQTIKEMISLILAGTEKHFMVVDGQQQLLGLIHFKDILQNANNPELEVKHIYQKKFEVIHPKDPLKDALKLITASKDSFIPVTDNGTIVGAIDASNLSEFILISSKIRAETS
jgi:Zn-dependent protease/CBS domain-containing protein